MITEPFLARFRRDIDALTRPGTRLGIAVSGGADSLALLLLAAGTRPGLVEAATVDHQLREASHAEALAVADVCSKLGVRHAILTMDWPEPPATAVQERARARRYALLSAWAEARGLDAILTGHHSGDQAETLLMRLNRGAGVRGLAGMRAKATVPGSDMPLVRPLLSWSRDDLERICADAGLNPVHDPSNDDPQFERVRTRRAVRQAGLESAALAAAARHLSEADEALDWAADHEWARSVSEEEGATVYRAADAPPEIVRRVVRRVIASLAQEGSEEPLRARALEPLLATLRSGGQATLRGVVCVGGAGWRFSRAPARRG